MRSASQHSATAFGSSPPTCPSTNGALRSRVSAIAIGACLGLAAGILWGRGPRAALVRAEGHGVPMLDVGRSHLGEANAVQLAVAASPLRIEPGPEVAIAAPSDGNSGMPAEKSDEPGGDTNADAGQCGSGMRLVDGDYCTMLVHRCIEPFTDGSGRCARYAEGSRCYPPVVAMRFCIDEYEYPNQFGSKPRVMVNFNEAKQACRSEQKRLCTAREWTLACEGPGRLPYPNGYRRDPAHCNIDLPHRFPNVSALNDPEAMDTELARLDQRASSGSRPECVSTFGVHDMVGNVDEWVQPDGPEEAAGLGAETALKGGYFGPVRSRCRPATPSHGPTFKFYQVGFRCCRDADPARTPISGR